MRRFWISLLLWGLAWSAGAQALEPRFYSNAPTGLNFALGGYGYSYGGVSFDPALNLDDAKLHVNTAVAAYARSLGFFGKSAKFDIVVPYSFLSGSARQGGSEVSRRVNGMNDPQFRGSINFIGAPALTLEEFPGYQQNFVMGASLKMTAPMGQYDNSRLINVGQNRWSFSPELGISKTFGSLIVEMAGAVTLFTDNDDLKGQTLEQTPIYSVQGHLIYTFPSMIWVALDGTYYQGGETTVGGVEKNNELGNSRLGATLALPVDKRNSVKLYASAGISTRTGSDFNTFGLAWQYRWGGGL
ncbi:transporter [Pontiellaceae bacterium B12219]|nr:transporter [Pontiellaceae bacterium B12219]